MRAGALLGLLAAGVAAALPAAAQAGARADYKQVFSTPVPGASTGTDTQILYKHPDDPEAKPIPVRQEVFTFPEGTRYDDSVVPICTATELEVQLRGEAACPRESWMGGGQGTTMTGFPGAGENPMQVDGWNDGSGLLLLGGDKQLGIRQATRAKRTGRVVTVEVPRIPGGPPDGESAIRKVHNVFAPRSLGDRAYTRTPSVCPASGVWRFHAHLTFADGVVEDDDYDMPCDRDVTAPRVSLAHHCVAHGLRVHVAIADASPLERVRVRLDRRLVRETTASSFDQSIRMRGLAPGRHRLTVVARDAAGNRARRTLVFSRCGAAGP